LKNLIDFDIEGERDVVAHEFEARIAQQVSNVLSAAGEEVVYAQNFVALLEQPLAEMGAQKAGSSGH
jgi:hypothetical protein